MTHYIHAPHKRNFAERPKRRTVENAKVVRHIRDGFDSVFRENIKLYNETAEQTKSKWIDRRVLWDLIDTPTDL